MGGVDCVRLQVIRSIQIDTGWLVRAAIAIETTIEVLASPRVAVTRAKIRFLR